MVGNKTVHAHLQAIHSPQPVLGNSKQAILLDSSILKYTPYSVSLSCKLKQYQNAFILYINLQISKRWWLFCQALTRDNCAEPHIHINSKYSTDHWCQKCSIYHYTTYFQHIIYIFDKTLVKVFLQIKASKGFSKF